MHNCQLNEFSKINNHFNRSKISMGKMVIETGISSKIYFWEGLPNSDEKSNLIIKNYVSIAPMCTFIMGGNHRSDWFTHQLLVDQSEMESDEIISKGDIIIGNDVWIGYNVTIMSGTDIPEGCVIGTNSVVSGHKFQPYDIIVGNPAVSVKKRLSEDVIEILLKLKWWDWEEEKIKRYSKLLKSNNIDELKKLL